MRIVLTLFLLFATAGNVFGQSTESRLEELEREIAALRAAVAAREDGELAELQRQLEALAEEVERLRSGEAPPPEETKAWGLAPSAAKVYGVKSGLSLGGYGEMIYQDPAARRQDGLPSGRRAEVDFWRAVVYLGYKFDDRFLLNTEIEYEHGTTSGGVGEVSVEFAYIDYLWRPQFNLRGGMVLLPVGLINELHEPTVFHGAVRPAVERTLIPSTWRENGLGVFGEVGPLAYRAFVVNGMDASRFSAGGWRGGRQKGAKAAAEDLAWVVRVDHVGIPGLLVGGSLYSGGAAQERPAFRAAAADPRTTLVEAHLDWRWRALTLRALTVHARLSDAAAANRALGLTGSASLGSRLKGWYGEAAWDLLPSRAALELFVRWEELDTQARVPAGFTANPANDQRILTLGLSFQPIHQIVLKADWQRVQTAARTGVNSVNLGLGYVF